MVHWIYTNILNSLKWLSSYFSEENLIKARQNKYFAINHSFATYAVAEAYLMTKIPILKVSGERGLKILLDMQNEDWGYLL